MDRRHLAVGAGTTGGGLALFAGLALTGTLRHPQAAAEQTQPAEFFAIGSGFFLLTVGILVLFFAYVEFPDHDA